MLRCLWSRCGDHSLGDVGRVALVCVRQGRVRRVRAVGRQTVGAVGQRSRDNRRAVGRHQRSADDRTRSGCWCRRGRGRGERQEGEKAELQGRDYHSGRALHSVNVEYFARLVSRFQFERMFQSIGGLCLAKLTFNRLTSYCPSLLFTLV